jgi:signal transduction histidine kinase
MRGIFVFICVWLLNCFTTFAQITVLEEESAYPITQIKYYETEATTTFEEVIANQSSFLPLKTQVAGFGVSNKAYWLHFSLNSTKAQTWTLNLHITYLKELVIYYQENGIWKKESLAYSPHNKTKRNTSFPYIQLDFLEGETKEFYVKAFSNGNPITIPILAKKPENLTSYQHARDFGYGLYFGALLIVLGINFFNLFLTKEKTYLFYIIYIAFLTSFNALIAGYFYEYVMDYLPLNHLHYRHTANAGFIAHTFLFLFVIYFLDLHKTAPKTTKYLVICLSPFHFIGWFLVVFGDFIDTVLAIMFIGPAFTFVNLYLAVIVLMKKHPQGSYFFVAYFIYFIFTLIYNTYLTGIYPDYWITEHANDIAILSEGVILSLAMSAKMNHAKFIAQTNLLIAEKNTNRLLEQKVAERTHKLHETNNELLKTSQNLHENMIMIEEQRRLLEQKATELETSNLVKTRLFSIIGHDLRSPINSLRTLLNFIKIGHITQPDFEELLPTIQHSVSGIHVTLENLLQWSITQLHGITPTFKTLYVHKLVEENISLFGVIARDKQIELVNQVGENVTCLADENHLRLIFRNLLSNAIKFTHAGGKIVVTNTTRDNLLCINIIDNGVGIAPEKLENLFDNTRWVSQYGTKGEKGIGLGLQLCKEIIELNNGYFEIKSELAKGSTFTLCLPYKQ